MNVEIVKGEMALQKVWSNKLEIFRRATYMSHDLGCSLLECEYDLDELYRIEQTTCFVNEIKYGRLRHKTKQQFVSYLTL